jgi:hypothetical protein
MGCFKRLLIEDCREARGIMATYIDLRSVQAEMVEDPRNCYRHCGYGAAMGGDERCRKGIMEVTGIKDWGRASAAYRPIPPGPSFQDCKHRTGLLE